MGERDGTRTGKQTDGDGFEFSNGIRLNLWQWLGLGVFALLIIVFAPMIWKEAEPFTPKSAYRMPHDLSNDYWLYERYVGLATQRYDILVLGDSVVWGEYVTRWETLSSYLNGNREGRERFGNLGLDGAHPLALSGLVRYYTNRFSGKTVLLHCNPLWMSSPRADLSDDKVAEINHPRLLPQFVPAVPAYKEQISPRIGTLLEHHLPFEGWTTHLQQAYYDRMDIPSWTLEHPYESPVAPLAHELPAPDDSLRHLPQPWYKSGITKQDYTWVDMETSLQWRAFRDTVELLQERGNRVFVLVGPFNEHLLTPEGLRRYQQVKATITAWLQDRQVPHLVPAPLPSDKYGDASHPLAAGYTALARELLESPVFVNVLR
jgi:hypothetical protein